LSWNTRPARIDSMIAGVPALLAVGGVGEERVVVGLT
jgi:hypothetical protein